MSDQHPPAPAPVPQPVAPQSYVAGLPPYRAPLPLPAAPAPPRTRTVGVVSLVLALAATALASLVAGVAGLYIGEAAAVAYVGGNSLTALVPASFAPVRGWVLVVEVSFWTGTVLGVWAVVQGIVGIVQRRGQGMSVAAVIIAGIGPAAFAVTVFGAISLGTIGTLSA